MKDIIKNSITLAFAGIIATTPAFANVESTEMVTDAVLSFEKVNINTASVEALDSLPGIGRKKAQAIIQYRKENGNFLILEDLMNVKGIGKKALAKLVSLITV